MTLLILYVSLALGVSFLCSVAESVLLSVTIPYAHLLEQDGKKTGKRLKHLKQDIDRPLAAILTLNTIAHTVGAAGAGAQASVVFGSNMLGIFSAVLTFLILVFSEIIPKTLGAFYWRQLAPAVSYFLHWMIILLYPFIKMSNALTRLISNGESLRGLSREEFSVMAELGEQEGELHGHESRILRNLLLLRDMAVKDVMTPRMVVFSLPEDMSVADYFSEHEGVSFSRIPVYGKNRDQVTGFVLRTDLISATGRGESQQALCQYKRRLPALVGAIDLLRAFEVMLEQGTHIMLVVDEYGGVDGVVTLEDIFETLLGMEIVDELDDTVDLQALAKRLARQRTREMGVPLKEPNPATDNVSQQETPNS